MFELLFLLVLTFITVSVLPALVPELLVISRLRCYNRSAFSFLINEHFFILRYSLELLLNMSHILTALLSHLVSSSNQRLQLRLPYLHILLLCSLISKAAASFSETSLTGIVKGSGFIVFWGAFSCSCSKISTWEMVRHSRRVVVEVDMLV